MVPPLRLKKIGRRSDEAETPEPRQESSQPSESGADTSSKYCIVSGEEVVQLNGTASTMGGDKSGPTANATNSIEIMIPSMPEFGIKETRTDRISLPQEANAPKPFIVNYILGKDV